MAFCGFEHYLIYLYKSNKACIWLDGVGDIYALGFAVWASRIDGVIWREVDAWIRYSLHGIHISVYLC